MNESLRTFVQAAHWPVMPEAGGALVRTLNDDDADAVTICRIIRSDPALSATLLRMANSAMFGRSGTVDSLERALAVVGLALLRARAIAVCLTRMAPLPPGLDRMTFWRWCLLCAGYAQWLAPHARVDAGQAWLAGILLRLGEINIGQARPNLMLRLQAQPIKPGQRWQRQHQLLGIDEGDITAELAHSWDFPIALVQALRAAAKPLMVEPFSRLAGVVHLGARLADTDGATAADLHNLPIMLLNILGLDPAKLVGSLPDPNLLVDLGPLVG